MAGVFERTQTLELLGIKTPVMEAGTGASVFVYPARFFKRCVWRAGCKIIR